MQRRYLLVLVVLFLSLAVVESLLATPIDFRIRSAGSPATPSNPNGPNKWEASIYDESPSGTGGIEYTTSIAPDSSPWDGAIYSYSVSWNAYTGTATFVAEYPLVDTVTSQPLVLFNLTRTFSNLEGRYPRVVALEGKDSDDVADMTMSVDGVTPITFSTSGIPGWVPSQKIFISDPWNISLSGTFQFSNDIFGDTQNNLLGQIQLKNFTPVPEPSTLLLLGSGLLSLWGLRKKFKK
jgi:hypothetical protein